MKLGGIYFIHSPEVSDAQNPSNVCLFALGGGICQNSIIPINIFMPFILKAAVETVEKYLEAELLLDFRSFTGNTYHFRTFYVTMKLLNLRMEEF